MKSVTQETFNQEVKQSAIPVIVDFYATWCGPCRAMKPVLEKLSTEANGAFSVVAVDVDECPDLASEFSISSIPTIMVFKNGKSVATLVGLQNKEKLLSALEQ